MPNAEVDEGEMAKLVSDGGPTAKKGRVQFAPGVGQRQTQRLECERISYVYLKLSVL